MRILRELVAGNLLALAKWMERWADRMAGR